MRLFFLICLLFSISSYAEEEFLIEKWQEFKNDKLIKNLPDIVTSNELTLYFGRSYDIYDLPRYAKIKNFIVEKEKIKIYITFPKVIFDVSDIEKELEEKWITNSATLSDLKLSLSNNYQVEIFADEPSQNIDGKIIKAGDEPKKFAEFKFISLENILEQTRKNNRFSNNGSPELSNLLATRQLTEDEKKCKTIDEAVQILSRIFKENGFEFAYIGELKQVEEGEESPGETNLTLYLNNRQINLEQLVNIIAYESKLAYSVDGKNVIIATKETFLISDAIRQKKNLKLPGLEVDVIKKQLILDGKICLSAGILEFLMCLPNSFEHESMFMTKVKPEFIHMGLLMIGSEPMPFELRNFEKKVGNKAYLDIKVEWTIAGKTEQFPLHKMIIDRSRRDKEEKLALDSWFFAGSFFSDEGIYAANIHKSVLSIQQHPASVIIYGEETEDPYRSDEFGFKVNSKICPPVDTPVKLIIKLKE